MKPLFLALIAATSLLQAQSSTQSIIGTITDTECADANHSRMRMGDTDAECTNACVEFHDATYMLFDGKVTYELSDQKAAASFAGKKVKVTGTVDAKAKRIAVASIAEPK